MEPHGDDLVVCPYCLAPREHTVKFKTLASHLEKIKKSNPELRKRKTCRFNIMHLIPKEELEQHHAVCPDRRMDMFTPTGDETSSPLDDSSALSDTMEDEPSSPQHSTSTFRLRINVHRPIGGYRRHIPAPEPEAPRLPVGMARIQALPSRTTSRQSARNAVSECKAFNKAHLC